MLFRGWPDVADKLEWRDVDSSDEWRRSFGLRVPVLTRGDDVICELNPDPVQLARCFGAAGKSV